MKALFVSEAGFLAATPGGVQACTREYLESIRAAGIELVLCPIDQKRSLVQRALHRITSNPYRFAASSGVRLNVLSTVRREVPDIVFLNQVSLLPLAGEIKHSVNPPPLVIALSHGAEITDAVYLARARGQLPLSGSLRPTTTLALGALLASESANRQHCDAIVVLSEQDIVFEQWFGARHVVHMPRVLREAQLDWTPVGCRLGYLGTLDHAPNLEGLVLALDSFARAESVGVRIRVIGGPSKVGNWLAERYSFVDYLGSLNDAATRCEAQTWTAFLHPLFTLSRGCSTKLATAVEWCIPIITTPLGRRGYTWRFGQLKECDSPDAFAAECMNIFDHGEATRNRRNVELVASSGPTLAESAAVILSVLGRVRESAMLAAAGSFGSTTPLTKRDGLSDLA